MKKFIRKTFKNFNDKYFQKNLNCKAYKYILKTDHKDNFACS